MLRAVKTHADDRHNISKLKFIRYRSNVIGRYDEESKHGNHPVICKQHCQVVDASWTISYSRLKRKFKRVLNMLIGSQYWMVVFLFTCRNYDMIQIKLYYFIYHLALFS